MFIPGAGTLLASTLRSATARPILSRFSARTIVTLKNVKYTATASAHGAGWNGTVESNGLKFDLALPEELNGTGKGENPEQLFSMGYAACLLGAIQAASKKLGQEEMAKNAIVNVSVHIGEPNELNGYGLAVDIKVKGVNEKLVEAGHASCPYSRAFTKGAVVNISLA